MQNNKKQTAACEAENQSPGLLPDTQCSNIHRECVRGKLFARLQSERLLTANNWQRKIKSSNAAPLHKSLSV
jgi:hypothetical protein